MQEIRQENLIIAPTGYVSELARLTGSTRQTVCRALKHGYPGKKAERIRQLYHRMYVQPKMQQDDGSLL